MSEKLKKMTKKELEKLIEAVNSKGLRVIMYTEGEKLLPFCILCNKIITGPHFKSIWVEPDFKRNYMYCVCDECSKRLGEPETTNFIEEKLMALMTSDIPVVKGEWK